MSTIIDRLHISEICTKPQTLEQDVALYRKHGLGIELWESKFSENDWQRQVDWLLEQGIPISSFQPRVLSPFPSMSVPQPEAPADRLKLMYRAIDRYAGLIPDKPLLTNTGADATGNEDRVWKGCVESFRRLGDYAAERQVKVAFEPLGASLMNRSTIIPNINIALDFMSEVNHPNVGLCADSYNLWESSAIRQVSLCGDKLYVVHLADWRRPRNFHDRFVPNEGVIPLSEFLYHVQQLDYAGDYVVELFSQDVPDSLWDQDAEDVVKRCKAGVEAAVAGIGSHA